MGRRLITGVVAFAMVLWSLPLGAMPAAAVAPNGPSPDLVISQVYGGGGNSGATYLNDFVELFNRGSASVSVTGKSLQYSSATGTGNFSGNPVVALSGLIAPGQYFLVRAASGGANGAPLPTSDNLADWGQNLAAGAGKVALVNSTAGLACNVSISPPPSGSTTCTTVQLGQIIDLVGYGNANFFEGTGAAPAPSATNSDQRKLGGCQDTDQNGADFAALAVAPRTMASPATACAGRFVISASKVGNGTVTSANAFISCGKACSASFTSGDSVTLSATPDFGWAFTGWSGACTTTSGPCVLTADAAKSATATFTLLPTFTLTVALSGAPGGSVTSADGKINCPAACSFAYPSGSSVTLSGNGGSGAIFTHWTGDCTASGACFITMDAAHAVGATFGVVPGVTSTSPANGAVDVPLTSTISITFSEDVIVSGNWSSLSCTHGAAPSTSASGGPTTYTLTPAAPFAAGQACTVTVFSSSVQSADGLTMSANYSFTFTTAIRIHDVQGAGHLSPFVGEIVSALLGIVTGRLGNGFYMEAAQPDWDGDERTSEGIFVFTSSAPTVTLGDGVTVRGRVQEFRPGSAGLTTTEIGGGPIIIVLRNGNTLPPAIRIGSDRIPPTEVIEDDASPDVETSGVFDPATDGIDFWESLEGMRVDLGPVIVTGPSPFHELSVLANNGAGATGRTPRGGIVVSATDTNPEKVVIRGVGFNMPDANTGDHFAGPIVGITDYDFNNFMVDVFTPITRIPDGVIRETAAPPGAHELTIATFNVENLSLNDPQSKFDGLASLIVNNLQAPDVISLEEVQDNNGTTNNGVVDATQTLTKLQQTIFNLSGITYSWRQINPVDGQDGGAPGGNIRQVFFFRSDLGVAFVDRPGAGSLTANAVVAGPQLQYSPGRIDPTNQAFNADGSPPSVYFGSRKPLAAEFTYNGHHLFVIANHWNSKGGDDPLWGRDQPPVQVTQTQRQAQAVVVRDFVQAILAADGAAEIVVLGDLNDFEYSGPVMTLKASGLTDLIETLREEERYTYVFEGNSQTLDHILVSSSLMAQHARTDVVHVNAEFFDQASDHDPQVATLPLFDLTPPTFTFVPASVLAYTGANAASCDTVVSDATLNRAAAAATDNLPGDVNITPTGIPPGNIFPVGSRTITYTATDLAGNHRAATQTVTVIDNTEPTIVPPADAMYQYAALVPAANSSQAVASDNCGVDMVTVAESNNGGAGSPTSPLFFVRVYTATDTSGISTGATQTITVIDDTPPQVVAPPDVSVTTGALATTCDSAVSDAMLGAATATDNAPGTPTISRAGVPAGNRFPKGTTPITYTATDAAGNTATATQQVTVVDSTPPLITAPGNATYQLIGQVPPANTADATASDNCGLVTITLSESNNGGAGSPASPLVITRTYTATDTSGNHASATQTITVIADTASLCQLVHTYVTNDGIANSLCAKLNAAAAARARGSLSAHDNQIQAFINDVNAQRGKALTDANANTLIALTGGL